MKEAIKFVLVREVTKVKKVVIDEMVLDKKIERDIKELDIIVPDLESKPNNYKEKPLTSWI